MAFGLLSCGTDSDFLKHLEICVNLGFSFLFESVDEYIDPIVDPVLEKNLVKKGNARTVKIGDKDVEWDDGFKLYLTSKLANPHYGMPSQTEPWALAVACR